jgi:hypothetical protein
VGTCPSIRASDCKVSTFKFNSAFNTDPCDFRHLTRVDLAATVAVMMAPGLQSQGPDLAVGSIPITRDTTLRADFVVSYMAFTSSVVKKPTFLFPDVLAVFQPFTTKLWVLIIVEVLIVAIAILMIEATKEDNEFVQAEGWGGLMYD